MDAFHTFLDAELPSGELLELCAHLSADGDVIAFDMWDRGHGWVIGKPWVPLPDDLGIDMDDLRERARKAAEAQARGWP